MATFQKFNAFVADLAEKVHNLDTDTLKILLTSVAPVAANHVKADVTEIGAGNGYTAGGNACPETSGAQVAGLYTLICSSPAAWIASGGTIGPFRYAVLYNSTAAAGNLIGFWDYGAAITLNAGESFTVALDPVNGVFILQ